MQILFDEKGLQAANQILTGARLSGVLSEITTAGWSHTIGPIDLLNRQDCCGEEEPNGCNSNLINYDVLVLTTRHECCYTKCEIKNIIDFVHTGGGLWCMSNHAAFDTSNMLNNLVKHDAAIASTFFTDFQAAAYEPIPGIPGCISIKADLYNHLIIRGKNTWPLATSNTTGRRRIKSISTRSFAGVYLNPFVKPVIGFHSAEIQNSQNGITANYSCNVVWAVAISGNNLVKKGRVIICGDSGWIGDNIPNPQAPGLGCFPNEDNAQYFLNSLAWLAHL